MPCGGICPKIDLKVCNNNIRATCFAMDIQGVDIVLGAQWLRTLGNIIFNYEKMFMLYQQKGRCIKLQGPTMPTIDIVSSHRMEKILRRNLEGVVLSCYKVEIVELLEDVQQIINKYSQVFEDLLVGLPPERDLDHSIPLVPGAGLVNVKAYRHPYHHRLEIEKITRDLVQKGSIQCSQSSFVALVVLSKKDGSYRMCVDYHALNKVMVKNCYPIP